MKQIYFILIAVIILNIKILSPIDTGNYDKSLYILEGNIGKRKATMYLNVENESSKLYGKYYYNDEKKFIHFVDGNINDKLILLREIGQLENYDIEESLIPILRAKFDNKKIILKGVRFTSVTDKKDKFRFELTKNYPINIIRSGLDEREKDGLVFLYESLMLNNPKQSSSISKLNNKLNNKNYFDILYNNYQAHKVKYKKEFDEDYRNAWSYEKTYEVIYMDKKIISLLEFDYSTTGGAHGTYSFLPSVFDLKNGNIINTQVTNFIKDINDEEIILLMRGKLREKSRYFEYDKIRLNNSFYFGTSNVYFIYNIYEIASYAVGTTTLEFSYYEIKPFVNPDSTFWYLFE